jgi:DNA sulfur modification protein DndD
MIISKVKIKNFQSYYDNTEVNLQKGLNLFLGTIGAGKSKLFNAFYWCFYDEIYKTDSGWLDINSRNFLSVFNKKCLLDADENDVIECCAELTVKSEKKTYNIKNQISIERINLEDYTSEKNWKFLSSDLIVSYDNEDGNRINLENFEARGYIDKKILPKQISKYIWFQGETLNELIDIKNGSTFRNAIKYISYIEYYNNNIKLIEEVIGRTEKELRKQKKNNTTNEKEYTRISFEIERLEGEIKSNKQNLENKQKELEQIEKVISDIDKRLNDINEFIELKNKEKSFESERKGVFEKLEELDKGKSNKFSKEWILKDTKELLNSGFSKLNVFQKWYEEKQNNNPTGLPYDIPSPSYLKEMLDKKECFVCGNKFSKESEHYKRINERLKNASGKIEEVKKENRELLSLNNKVTDLLSNEGYLNNLVDTIETDIKEYFETQKELISKKNGVLDSQKDIKDEITALQERHGNKMTDSFVDEKSQYNYNIEEKDRIKTTLRSLDSKSFRLMQEMNRNKTELDKIPQNIAEEYQEEKVLKYLYILNDAYNKTLEQEFEKLIDKVEGKANSILYKITKANKVINGKIKIDRDSYNIKLVDLDDNDNRDINTGHNNLTKMCIINAMVLISNEYKNKSYSFITDAPTSDLDDGTSKLYYRVVSDEFEQSVVLTKDLFVYKKGKNEVDIESLKQFKFNNVFIIKKEGASEDLTESNSYSKLEKII